MVTIIYFYRYCHLQKTDYDKVFILSSLKPAGISGFVRQYIYIYTFRDGEEFIFSSYCYQRYQRIEHKEVITHIHTEKAVSSNAKVWEVLKKLLNLLSNSSCIFGAGYRKALLSRYLEAVLGRKMYLLSCQCWNGWIWDLRLLLRCWISNSTNLPLVYTANLSPAPSAAQRFMNWAEFTETSTSKNLVLLKQELESINDTIRSQAEQNKYLFKGKNQ